MGSVGDFEDVLTMTDYYDGPPCGISKHEGHPHLYESEWDKRVDNYSEVYRLSPVRDSVLEAALEDWAIWLRWERAFRAGRVDEATHPALPEDRERHDSLKGYLKRHLKIDPEPYVRARGEFKRVEDRERSDQAGTGLRVRWSIVQDFG